jgi:predicted GNAT superfamily acetyltransferase
MKLEDIIYAHNSDVRDFMDGDGLSWDLYTDLYDYYTSLNKLSYAALKAIDVDPMHEVSDLFAEDCRSLGISYEYN